ncbi:PAS fold [Ekhidna lutea]|uniref:PAS fold n=1 Tax=Ekhidna lutea TaxID=447679 RepID=A0A239H0T6_EKHLU|nr:PAS domain-containing protein [Ekhidna lutea]SNS74792.1 PAS fold [Ekhidna lutea]
MEPHLDIDKLNDAYIEGEESYQLFIEPLEVGVGVYNSNASPIACNPAAYKLLGLSKEQFMGNTAMDPYWKVTHADGSKFETYDFPIVEVITSYKPKLGVIMGVSRPLLNDKVWLEVNTHPVLNADGTIHYVFCTYKDITEKFNESLD